ncbi:MAG TPA: hypothetical protein DD640_03005, partial [Clostridiales bacterium]|nr:hypothetical protein [Clostridiales bacterium]
CTVWLFYAVHDHYQEKDQPKRDIQGFILLNLLFLALRVLIGHEPADWASLQSLSVLAVPLCYLLNQEKRPKTAAKYAFYVFYPLHVLVLLLIRILIWPN